MLSAAQKLLILNGGSLMSGGGGQIPANALTLNGQLITLNGQPITKAS